MIRHRNDIDILAELRIKNCRVEQSLDSAFKVKPVKRVLAGQLANERSLSSLGRPIDKHFAASGDFEFIEVHDSHPLVNSKFVEGYDDVADIHYRVPMLTYCDGLCCNLNGNLDAAI